MKANELMVEDWILAEGNPVQVTMLSTLGGDVVGVLKPFMSNEEIYASNEIALSKGAKNIKHLKPICLTSEILKNNEFVISEIGGLFWQSQDTAYDANGNPRTYVSVLLMKDGSIRELEVSNGKHFYKKGYNGNNVYVHNLQHALKQCNIEKKIFI